MAPSRFQTFTFTFIQRLRGNFFCGDKFHIHFGYGASFFAETNFASDGKFAGSIFWSGATGQDFSRSKILQAMKSLPQVFFGPGLRGEIFGGEKFCKRWKACKKYFLVFFYENPNPDPIFFVYVKLLISLLNGAFFRLGDNFSVRGYGARFSAGPLQQLFKLMVGTPTSRFKEN